MKLNMSILALVLLLLPACLMLGPSYKKPRVTIPRAFTQLRAEAVTDAPDIARWWRVYDDENLISLIECGAQHNYDLRLAVERIEEIRALYRLQQARLFPEIAGVAALNRTHYSANLVQYEFLTPEQRTLDFLSFGIEVLWELDVFGRLRRAAQAARAEYEAQIEDARGVYVVLLSNIAEAYVDLKALEKRIHLTEERIALDTTLLQLQGDRFGSGIDSNILVQQTVVQLEESKSLLTTLNILYAQTMNALAVLVGEFPEGFELSESPIGVPLPSKKLATGLPSDLLERRPDIRRAERLLRAATERIGEAVADYFPRFNLLATVTTDASRLATWFASGSLNWFIGSEVRCPLITFGRLRFTIESRNSVQRQALLAYCQAVVVAFAEVEDALIAYFKEADRVAILTVKLNAIVNETALVKDRFHSGLADQSEFVLTDKTRIEIEEQLVEAQRAYSKAFVFVYKALGGGWREGDVQDCA